MFCAELERNVDYSLLVVDEVNNVKHSQSPTSNSRVFVKQCNCPKRKAFMIKCCHELRVSNGEIDITKFDWRWLRDDSVNIAAMKVGECSTNCLILFFYYTLLTQVLSTKHVLTSMAHVKTRSPLMTLPQLRLLPSSMCLAVMSSMNLPTLYSTTHSACS